MCLKSFLGDYNRQTHGAFHVPQRLEESGIADISLVSWKSEMDVADDNKMLDKKAAHDCRYDSLMTHKPDSVAN